MFALLNEIQKNALASCRRRDAWSWFETCLVHCVVLLLGSDVSHSQCLSLLRNIWRYYKTAKELCHVLLKNYMTILATRIGILRDLFGW